MSARCCDEACLNENMEGLLLRFKVLFAALAIAAIVALAVYGNVNADIGSML